DWVVGVAGAEIPWLGTVKLATSSNSAQVTGHAWRMLGLSAIILLAATFMVEQVTEKILTGAPEITQAMLEEESHSEEE
ncbi:MAG: hypothetical protein QF566_05790, partial [Candidatus Thalassarchaeaceae archaeon]|nr:hypothetical protein [Candidatus Thalassarchaeaceae archaeon]